MRTTIREVSERAGVSVGTVSNVLNAPQLVAEDTRQRVMEAVEDLGYRPNRAGRSLAGQRSFLIGYRLPDYVESPNPTLDAFLHHLVAHAGRHGLEIVLFAPSDEQEETGAFDELIRRGAVDGFVVSDTNYEDPRIELLVERGFPFVAFGRARNHTRFSWVDLDGAAGVAAAVRHLTERGHRRIGMIAWPEGSESGDARLEGFTTAMVEAGLDPGPVVRAENVIEEGRRAVAELLDGDDPPSAIVAIQDALALGALLEAHDRGLRVGEDLALTGFDDTPLARACQPQLTSVRQPFEQIGAALLDMLVAQLEEDGTEPRGELVAPQLVVRESTGGGDAGAS